MAQHFWLNYVLLCLMCHLWLGLTKTHSTFIMAARSANKVGG